MFFAIDKLTEFNPAVILDIVPELSPDFKYANSTSFLDLPHHLAQQLIDICNAYLYAQNLILPLIRRVGIANITNDQWLRFLIEINVFCSNYLATKFQLRPGELRNESFVFWKYGPNFPHELEEVLTAGGNAYKDKLAIMIQKYNLDSAEFDEFMNFVKGFYNKSIYVDSLGLLGSIFAKKTLNQLLADKFNHFAPEQQQILEKFLVIYYSQDICDNLLEIFKFLSQELTSKDGKNLQILSPILANFLHRIYQQCPFQKANLRTFSCLIDIILRYYGHSQAILGNNSKAIDTRHCKNPLLAKTYYTLEQLADCISQRVNLTSQAYYSSYMSEYTLQLLDCSCIYSKIITYCPQFDVNNLFEISNREYEAAAMKKYQELQSKSAEPIVFCGTTYEFEKYNYFYKKLLAYAKELIFTPEIQRLDPCLTRFEWTKLKKALMSLSAGFDCQWYLGAELTGEIFFVSLNSQQNDKVDNILHHLMCSQACRISSHKNPNNSGLIIKVHSINLDTFYGYIDKVEQARNTIDEQISMGNAIGF